VIGRQDTYFARHHSDSLYKYSEADIKGMLVFLLENIYAVFGNQVYQKSVGIPMGTKCAHLLAYLFLYSYEAEIVQKLLQDQKTSRVLQPHIKIYIDDVLPINNHPVRIRVRIHPPHPLVCPKRRLNGAVLRMRPEKPRSRVTAGVAR
jgi:hypothetical protein